MPSESDRQEAAEARRAFLQSPEEAARTEFQDTDPNESNADDQPEPQVEVTAVFVPQGIEVRILIPHEGIVVNLPDLPNTIDAYTDGPTPQEG